MAVREILKIDEELCNGCGDCVVSCEEGAIRIIDGKAKLIKDEFCDGLGACIGECPTGALTIEKREAPEFDEVAVEHHLARTRMQHRPAAGPVPAVGGGCPGSAMRQMPRPAAAAMPSPGMSVPSQLGQWPIQLMLVPPFAPFLEGADLVICADCVPFTVPDFHTRYLTGRAVVIGCPKLDDLPHYFEKLKEIFATAQPRKVTVLKMEVPCCGGIAAAAVRARDETGSPIPVEVHTMGIQGGISIETIYPEESGSIERGSSCSPMNRI